MKLIVFDFLRRWWWILASLGIFSLLIGLGHPVSLAPWAVALFMTDAQRGVHLAVRLQPVSRRDQERAWWLASVCVPLLFLPVMAAGVMLRQWAQVRQIGDPWFTAGMVWWVGTGLGALMFMLSTVALPRRPAETPRGTFAAALMGAVWGLSIPGSLMIMMTQTKSLEEIQPWHGWLAALVPVAVFLSYHLAPVLMQIKTCPAVPSGDAKHQASARPLNQRSGSTGLRLLVTTLLGRTLGFLLITGAVMMLVLQFPSGGPAVDFSRLAAMLIFLPAFIIPSFVPEWFSLRMLRSMPVSTRRLSLVLLCVPAAASLLTAIPLVWMGALGAPGLPPWLDGLFLGLFAAGLGAAALTFMCHLTTHWRFVVFVLPAMILPDLLAKTHLHFYLFLVGAVLLVASYLFMQRGFWRSPGFYRYRQNHGVNASHPLGAS